MPHFDHDYYDAFYPMNDATYDKIQSDILYAFMWHEAVEAKTLKIGIKHMHEDQERQDEYDRQESGYYEMKELEAQIEAEACSQITYMHENNGRMIGITKPLVLPYLASVKRIEELLK